MKILLISDTHSYLDPKVLKHLKDVDEVWHAGDVGDIKVIDEIKKHKPLKAVYGNIDDHKVRADLPGYVLFEINGINVGMLHIAGNNPNKYPSKLQKWIKKNKVKLLVCGHSHLLKVMTSSTLGNLHMNPGACGNHGFHKVKTMLKFSIIDGNISNLEVIEWNR